MTLSADATEPARLDALANLGPVKAPDNTRVSKPREARNVDPVTGKPRRGRPPGSPNKPKEGMVAPQSRGDAGTVFAPPSRGGPTNVGKTPEQIAKELQAKLRQKRERAAKYSEWLSGEFSEMALEAIVNATPIEAEWIFTKEAPSVKRSRNPNLTELGQRFAVPPDVADAWGKVLSELSQSTAGGKLVESFESGNAGLILAVLMCALTTSRWVRQVKGDLDAIAPLIQAKAQAEAAKATAGMSEAQEA